MPNNPFEQQPQDPAAPGTSTFAAPGARGRARHAQGLSITVVSGIDRGVTQSFAQNTVLIGRAAGTDFRLSDPTASAFHVELSSHDEGIEVRDLKSRNGTRYAGARFDRAVVPNGSLVEVGQTSLRVELGAALDDDDARSLASFGELSARSRAMRDVLTTLARLARTDLSVLVEGPTGSGKELAARALHGASRFRDGPFVVLDCTAIPHGLAESILFGHEKGAFTGAAEARAGVFEQAAGGTVFLDEVGELPLDLQPKLLRVLERREVVRVGGTRPRPLELRVVSATWRELRAMINDGRFREDLYYRLAQARVVIPSLDERPEDVPHLIQRVLDALPAGATAARAITPEALAELCGRTYPGNVRELKSTVERAALMAEGSTIAQADLAFERMLLGQRARATPAADAAAEPRVSQPPPPVPSPRDDGPPTPFKDAKRSIVEEFERTYLARLLARTGGNVSRAAAMAGIERHHFHNLARKHGLGRDDG